MELCDRTIDNRFLDILDENRYFYNKELILNDGKLFYKDSLLTDGLEIDADGQAFWIDEINNDDQNLSDLKWQADATDSKGWRYKIEWDFVEPDFYKEMTEDEKREDLKYRGDFEDFADWEHPIRVWFISTY